MAEKVEQRKRKESENTIFSSQVRLWRKNRIEGTLARNKKLRAGVSPASKSCNYESLFDTCTYELLKPNS